ncbi:hypothetical protein GCM10009623_07120 [Nocardioides aestuarii]|uniref:DUF732 domain-containing protein n=1 Tax=Nocardioides aestuarii TaxID=252231 RepID=A0ABW4TFF3_9ACTN
MRGMLGLALAVAVLSGCGNNEQAEDRSPIAQEPPKISDAAYREYLVQELGDQVNIDAPTIMGVAQVVCAASESGPDTVDGVLDGANIAVEYREVFIVGAYRHVCPSVALPLDSLEEAGTFSP